MKEKATRIKEQGQDAFAVANLIQLISENAKDMLMPYNTVFERVWTEVGGSLIEAFAELLALAAI